MVKVLFLLSFMNINPETDQRASVDGDHDANSGESTNYLGEGIHKKALFCLVR